MCEIQLPNFTATEQYFINRTLNGLASPNIDVQHSMILNLCNDILENQDTTLVTDEAKKLIESITHKVLSYQLAKEIDDYLADPTGYEEKAKYEREVEESTRSLSLKATLPNLSSLHLAIIDHLRNNPDISRRELSGATGISLQSCCARVRELIDGGMVKVSGRTYDQLTQRYVQTLEVV
jgi:hypothetical protein